MGWVVIKNLWVVLYYLMIENGVFNVWIIFLCFIVWLVLILVFCRRGYWEKKKKEELEFFGLCSRYIYSILMFWCIELSLFFFFGGGGGGDRMKFWF